MSSLVADLDRYKFLDLKSSQTAHNLPAIGWVAVGMTKCNCVFIWFNSRSGLRTSAFTKNESFRFAVSIPVVYFNSPLSQPYQ